VLAGIGQVRGVDAHALLDDLGDSPSAGIATVGLEVSQNGLDDQLLQPLAPRDRTDRLLVPS